MTIPPKRNPENAGVCKQFAGKGGWWEAAPGLRIQVLIHEARSAYGRIHLHVKPIAGSEGSAWVWRERVAVDGVAADVGLH